ncbi:NEDD8-conjugating protein ubc12 [Coelomomyces lativittatus]|nr:NEDD8-conjugating protein ubc12 [Coelomomyces lativittatus]KAJ1513274.1 NEDD8-conjugating protein ubc12 [Coelomomyces lativittatus]
MIKLMSLKKQKSSEDSEDSEKKNTTNSPSISAAERRIQKDLTELDLPSTFQLTFQKKDHVMDFVVYFRPNEGFYQGGEFIFTCHIPETYPHEPPKLHAQQTLFHPNIDLDGNICLNILREDWKPVLNLTSIFVGLQFLFLEPNAEDPLNKEAANVLKSGPTRFAEYVRRSMLGDFIDGTRYDHVMHASKHHRLS